MPTAIGNDSAIKKEVPKILNLTIESGQSLILKMYLPRHIVKAE